MKIYIPPYNPFQKQKLVRSKNYREYIMSIPCLFTQKHGAIPHHETFGMNSKSKKVSDLYCLPIAEPWHTRHKLSRHNHPGGAKAFWGMVNVDPMLECLKLINYFFANGGRL